jgi:hypothetical protein
MRRGVPASSTDGEQLVRHTAIAIAASRAGWQRWEQISLWMNMTFFSPCF